MTHAEFLRSDRDPNLVWGIRNLFRSIGIVWGIGPVLGVGFALGMILAPSLAFLGYCVWHGRYAACVWGLLGVMALVSARGVSCAGGCLPILEIPIAIGISLGTRSPLHVVGALLALPTYFAAGFVKSITVFSMGPILRESPEVFARMDNARQIDFVRADNWYVVVTPMDDDPIEI